MISRFLRRDDVAKEVIDMSDVCYSEKYSVEYIEMCNKMDDQDDITTQIIESDETPAGMVHIRRDPTTKMSIWYSNSNSIPNTYLDAIMRKMAIANKKPSIYYYTADKIKVYTQSFNDEWDKLQIVVAAKSHQPTTRDLFVKPKTIKMDEGTRKNLAFRKGIDLIKSKTNKYKRGGTLYDYQEYTSRELELVEIDELVYDDDEPVISVTELQSMSYTNFKDKYIANGLIQRKHVNSGDKTTNSTIPLTPSSPII
jgi:hypothetical protein